MIDGKSIARALTNKMVVFMCNGSVITCLHRVLDFNDAQQNVVNSARRTLFSYQQIKRRK